MNTTKNKGFTLIEVMTTIAIIGILAGVTFVSFNYMKKKSNDSKRKIDIANINLAIQRYITAKGYAPTVAGNYYADELNGNWATLGTELNPYLSVFPKDPCGIKCFDPSVRLFYTYVYDSTPPFHEYMIYAQNLETQSGSYSIGTSAN